MISRLRALCTALVVTLVAYGSTASAGTYTVTDLGTLGGSRSYAAAINARGDVVGYSTAGPDHQTTVPRCSRVLTRGAPSRWRHRRSAKTARVRRLYTYLMGQAFLPASPELQVPAPRRSRRGCGRPDRHAPQRVAAQTFRARPARIDSEEARP